LARSQVWVAQKNEINNQSTPQGGLRGSRGGRPKKLSTWKANAMRPTRLSIDIIEGFGGGSLRADKNSRGGEKTKQLREENKR